MAPNRRSVLKSIGAATGLGVVGGGATGQVAAATLCDLTGVPGETDGLATLADEPAVRRDVIEAFTGDIVASYVDRGVLPATDPYSVFDYETYDPTRGPTDLNDGFEGISATGYVESEAGEPVPGGAEVTVVRASAVVDDTYVALGVKPALENAVGLRYANPATTVESGVGTNHIDGATPVKVEIDSPVTFEKLNEKFKELNSDDEGPPGPEVPWVESTTVGGGDRGDDTPTDVHAGLVGGDVAFESKVPTDVSFGNDDEMCFWEA